MEITQSSMGHKSLDTNHSRHQSCVEIWLLTTWQLVENQTETDARHTLGFTPASHPLGHNLNSNTICWVEY